jgi:hypothetical protein
MNLLYEVSMACFWTIKVNNFLLTACSQCNEVIQLGLVACMPSQFSLGWYEFYLIISNSFHVFGYLYMKSFSFNT